MSSLPDLKRRLQKMKEEREKEKKRESLAESSKENTTENFTDFKSWLCKIQDSGNKPEDWLKFTDAMGGIGYTSETMKFSCLSNYYNKALKAIPVDETKRSTAYAQLLVNCANLKSLCDVEEARSVFSAARTSSKHFAFVHIAAAQLEVTQGERMKAKRILEKAQDIGAEPRAEINKALQNLLLGHQVLIQDRGTILTEGTVGKENSDVSTTGDDIMITPPNDVTQSRRAPHSTTTTTTIAGDSEPDSSPSLTYCTAEQGFYSLQLEPKLTQESTLKAPTETVTLGETQLGEGAERVRGNTGQVDQENQPAPVKSLPRIFTGKTSSGAPLKERNASGEGNNTASWQSHKTIYSTSKAESLTAEHTTDSGIGTVNYLTSSTRKERGMRQYHSTPDCKNPCLLSNSSRRKKFSGKPMRVLKRSSLPELQEGSTQELLGEAGDEMGLEPLPESTVLDFSTPSISKTMTTRGTEVISGADTFRAGSLKVPTLKVTGPEASRPEVDTSPPAPLLPHRPEIQAIPAPVQPLSQPVPQAPPSLPAAPQPPPPAHMNQPPAAHPQMWTPMTKQNKTFTINGRHYLVHRVLGRGGSSKVYEAWDQDNKMRAIKCVNLDGADESTITSYRNEISHLQRLQSSEYVIKLFDFEYQEDEGTLFIVMEKGETDLANFFKTRRKGRGVAKHVLKFYWEEMLQAVQVLHQEGIVHSDLKPANFLLVDGNVKLIDFGIAKAIQRDMTSVTVDQQVGTLNYMSPEAILDTMGGTQVGEDGRVKPRIKIGVKSDVWSLGCILYTLVHNHAPFYKITNPIMKMQAIINPNYKIEFPTTENPAITDVLKLCLARDPKVRASIDDLLRHSYLCG